MQNHTKLTTVDRDCWPKAHYYLEIKHLADLSVILSANYAIFFNVYYMKKTICLSFLLAIVLQATAQTKTATVPTLPVRTGQHSFTIQWITFEKGNKPGTVMIRKIGTDEYSIEGEQRDKLKNDYVTIKGTFLAKGRELKFNGKIVSQVSYVNNGNPCESTGLVIFKASGKRKYWRLQQMLNCDGSSTDYVDIFF